MFKLNKLKKCIQTFLIGSFVLANTACVNENYPTASQFTQNLTNRFFNLNSDKTSTNFMWGVSSAGYQSEGYDPNSQWHHFDMAGKTKHRRGTATDFYHRYKEDIQLAKDMGANSFRLSIEWSRVQPQPGVFSTEGIAYYHDVINEVKRQGLEPLVTLVHFTYPQWLDIDSDRDKKVGFEDPDAVDAYVDYVDRMAREFSPAVKYWITFNEPNIWVPLSYLLGKTAPGRKKFFGFFRAARNVIRAHGRAYDRIHGVNPQAMVSSNIFHFAMKNPFSSKRVLTAQAAHRMTAQRAAESLAESPWFMDALTTGRFPYSDKELFPEEYRKKRVRSQGVNDGVFKLLGKFDYIAFDYYYRFKNLKQLINADKPWLIDMHPEGLYGALMMYAKKFNKPIVIAENGISTYNHDPRQDGWTRSASIVQHIKQVQRAIKDGANVIGYYHWSITDNYEWGEYDGRFGLYTVDVLTDPELKRIPTPAVNVYKEVIANNGVNGNLLVHYPDPHGANNGSPGFKQPDTIPKSTTRVYRRRY